MDHAISQLHGIYEDVQKERIQIESDSDNHTENQLLRFIEGIPGWAGIWFLWIYDMLSVRGKEQVWYWRIFDGTI